MRHIVYDTGALVSAERRRNARVWGIHSEVTAAGLEPIVPVVVLAQAWRGGPQAQLSRLLRGCKVHADDEILGRAAGRACAVAGSGDVVDAIVVVTAIDRQAGVVTSDPDDLRRLADAVNVKLPMYVVLANAGAA